MRAPVTSDLLAAGPALFAIVALAGFSIGFFAWLGLIVPRHHAFVSDLGLLVALAGGTGATLWLWQWYARYFSRRTGATYARSLRYDAFTWVPFLLLWLTFVLPPALTHGEARDLCCVRRGFLRRQSAHRGALQSDRARGAARLRRHAHRHHRHRRAGGRHHRTACRHRTSKSPRTSCSTCGAAGMRCTTSTSRRKGIRVPTWRSSRSFRC